MAGGKVPPANEAGVDFDYSEEDAARDRAAAARMDEQKEAGAHGASSPLDKFRSLWEGGDGEA